MIEFLGPLDDIGGMYYLAWEGCIVPHLTARKIDENDWMLLIWRGNCGFMEGGPYSAAALHAFIPMMAQIAAVAGGYTAFGVNGKQANPYAVQTHWMIQDEPAGPLADQT